MQVSSFGAIMRELGLEASTQLLYYEEIVKDEPFIVATDGGASRMELLGLLEGKPAVHYRAIIRRDVAQRIIPLAREHESHCRVFSTFNLFGEIGCHISRVN